MGTHTSNAHVHHFHVEEAPSAVVLWSRTLLTSQDLFSSRNSVTKIPCRPRWRQDADPAATQAARQPRRAPELVSQQQREDVPTGRPSQEAHHGWTTVGALWRDHRAVWRAVVGETAAPAPARHHRQHE